MVQVAARQEGSVTTRETAADADQARQVASPPPRPGLSPVGGKPLAARFDGGRLSCDGGVLALREIERRLGIAERLAGCLDGPRTPEAVRHSLADMIRFRPLMIAAGCEEGNDAGALRHDPAFTLALDRLPDAAALCSQPTISWLKNLPDLRALLRAGRPRGLAMAGPPGALLPELPSISAALPGVESTAWHGVVARARTPPEIVERLHRAIAGARTQSDKAGAPARRRRRADRRGSGQARRLSARGSGEVSQHRARGRGTVRVRRGAPRDLALPLRA